MCCRRGLKTNFDQITDASRVFSREDRYAGDACLWKGAWMSWNAWMTWGDLNSWNAWIRGSGGSGCTIYTILSPWRQ